MDEKRAVELERASAHPLRIDEALAVAQARLRGRDDLPPIIAVTGEMDVVEALLAHLDGHSKLRVLPTDQRAVLRSVALERAVRARERDADDARAAARATLAGWIDEQGADRERARWVVGAGLPNRGSARRIVVSEEPPPEDDELLMLKPQAVRDDPSWAAQRVTHWMGLAPEPALRTATHNRRPVGAVTAPRREPQSMPTTAALEPAASILTELTELAGRRVEDPVPVDQPLVLVSQIQRSGGHLLNQLLDGHPEVHAHPHELHIGYPDAKRQWPRLDAGLPSLDAFERLYEVSSDWLRSGYGRKRARALQLGGNAPTPEGGLGTLLLPFLIVPSLARAIFLAHVDRHPPTSPRELLDAWFTAYFNAWLDNANLAGDKRWVTAFVAVLMTVPGERDRFLADYPDGRLIGIVREPASWWASARAHGGKRYRARDTAIEAWSASTSALIEAAEAVPGQVLLVDFDALVGDTEVTGRRIARWLGIAETPSLGEPTFNGLPISANSSFPVDRHGVLEAPLQRADAIGATDRDAIRHAAGDLHAAALAIAAEHARRLDRRAVNDEREDAGLKGRSHD